MHPTLAGFYPFLLESPARCTFLLYLCLYICLGSPARSRLSRSAVALTSGWSTSKPKDLVTEDKCQHPNCMSVTNSIARFDAASPIQLASTIICARNVDKLVMEKHHVERKVEEEVFEMRPRYLRYNLWSPDADPMVTAAEWTLSALPLPRPPVKEYGNLAACQTLSNYPKLFKIVTPLKIHALEFLLKSHPNRAFVESVLDGLREGLWPWASTVIEGYPTTLDKSKTISLSLEKEEFLRKQLLHEEGVSPEFGESLLPGMYCMPTYLVPKPQLVDWRLVNDLSAGPFFLNSMVDHRLITGFPLDNLAQFGELLMRKHSQNLGKCLVAVRATAERLSQDLAGDPKHIYKHKYDRKRT